MIKNPINDNVTFGAIDAQESLGDLMKKIISTKDREPRAYRESQEKCRQGYAWKLSEKYRQDLEAKFFPRLEKKKKGGILLTSWKFCKVLMIITERKYIRY